MTTATVVKCTKCDAKNRVPAAATGKPQCARCHSPLKWVADANEKTFAATAEQSKVPVVIDLWAPWCGPCRTVSPLLDQLAQEFAGKLKLVKVNVDEAPSVQARFAVQGIPTLIMFDRGREVDRLVGAHPVDKLRSWIRQTVD